MTSPVQIIPTTKIVCPNCGILIYDDEISKFSHKDRCEYYNYKFNISPSLKMVSVGEHLSGNMPLKYLETILDSIGINYRTFIVNYSIASIVDIFVPSSVAQIIKSYNENEGFAGLTFEEYLIKMYSPGPT